MVLNIEGDEVSLTCMYTCMTLMTRSYGKFMGTWVVRGMELLQLNILNMKRDVAAESYPPS